MTLFQAKDFIQTSEGLVFAVVEQGLEEGKVLCFLRYQLINGAWKKLATQQANELLKAKYPQYLFYSSIKSAHLHAVNVADINIHHQPKQRLQTILVTQTPDEIEQDLMALCRLLKEQGIVLTDLGITGSMLIGAQNASSDIDLVVYGREKFHQLRAIIQQLIKTGQLQHLDQQAWLDSYQRRSCELSYEDYVWHEQRKYNKALINNRKFDLNLIADSIEPENLSYQKQGSVIIQAQVKDAHYSFDYPAKFLLNHSKITEVICYTATYTGQAEQGEWVEIAGQLEQLSSGVLRLLVGSTREAKGEYIKVINAKNN